MREILFRGKRTENGETRWIEGFYAKSGDSHFILTDNSFAVGYVKMKEVIPETVSEYTGLMDNNGKRIFEGDIIQYKTKYDVAPIYSYVVYCADTDNYPAFDLVQHAYETNGLQCACKECLCEVVGNKWDNPELIEVKE